ncbi:MAG: guanylate kinase [Frankia sp.]|nr:guanylate kinase [Frankia sp.]
MTGAAVLLYGPPGAGKDTITRELSRISPAFTLFERLKAGPGRTAGYRRSTCQEIDELERAGQLLYRHSRYGAEYAIDRPGMARLLADGRTPVVHMGQITGIGAVTRFPAAWTLVLLWCPYDVTKVRCVARGDTDVDARLRAWEETRLDLLEHSGAAWSLVVPTDLTPVSAAARAVVEAVAAGAPATPRDIGCLLG